MKKSRKKNSREKTAPKNRQRFRLATTSGRILPLQTIRERLIGIWNNLTWPIWVKIIKANIAVTIALSLLMIEPIRELSSVSAILGSVAVEFVYPNKSYGFIGEDVLIGSIMCSISAAWSILGQYLASLVRNPDTTQLAEPRVCAILAFFLVSGCFILNMVRVKLEQANVGGMLSATIMAISLTSAVKDKGFSPLVTVR